MSGLNMQPKIVFEPHIPTALQRALDYAGNHGFVASLPDLLRATGERALRQYRLEYLVHRSLRGVRGRHTAGQSPSSWRFTVEAFSERPERFEQSLYADMDHRNTEGLTGEGAAKIDASRKPAMCLTASCRTARQSPYTPSAEFRRGIERLAAPLWRRHRTSNWRGKRRKVSPRSRC